MASPSPSWICLAGIGLSFLKTSFRLNFDFFGGRRLQTLTSPTFRNTSLVKSFLVTFNIDRTYRIQPLAPTWDEEKTVFSKSSITIALR
ncbi:hypothetical protein ATANTOWER_031717 [Ataeniobius toweri]|uniref:Secreted protein n=1 Tax=Ataeniobius toweri TaxID=208326 RepID=A0ABU7C4Y6_9TELE|nr:hypothetical protein [Ataeniobius toweri]